MLKTDKKIFYILGVIPIVAFVLFVALLTEEKTYSYENASSPPPEPISTYSDYFVDSVQNASKIVGYTVSEPVLPDEMTLQLIGIHGDRVVQLYASSHQISERTLGKEFTYELQGILIFYERIPSRLSHMSANTLIEQWAEGEDIETSLKFNNNNNRIGAVKEISIGRGPSGTFDMPATAMTSISDDVLISASGFYDGNVLKSLLTD